MRAGGVAAEAWRCAEAGARTIVLSTDPAHSLADAYDVELGSSSVRLRESISLTEVASIHVDAAEAADDVAAAADVIDEALAGDPDAQFTVDGAEDHELAWYDVSEIDHLI